MTDSMPRIYGRLFAMMFVFTGSMLAGLMFTFGETSGSTTIGVALFRILGVGMMISSFVLMYLFLEEEQKRRNE